MSSVEWGHPDQWQGRDSAKREAELRAEVERLREDVTAYGKAIHASLMGMEQLTDDELGPGGGARRAFAGLWHAYHAIPAGIPTPPSSEALAPADTGEQD